MPLHYLRRRQQSTDKAYYKNYPLYSEWVNILHKGIFPIILIAITTWRIAIEWRDGISAGTLFNSVLYILLMISVAIYMWSHPVVRTISLRRAKNFLVLIVGLFQLLMPFKTEEKWEDPELHR